jgi:hypothetical protein
MERFYKVDAEAVRFFQDYKMEDGTYLPEDIQERYITNASVINAVFALKAAREFERISKKGSLTGIWDSLCSDCVSFNRVLLQKYDVEHDLPENKLRFKEKCLKYKENSYLTLVKRNLKNTNALKVTDDVISLLNNLFAGRPTKPTYTEVAAEYDSFLDGYTEVINNSTGELYDPKSFGKLSKATVYNWLSKWENLIGSHAKRSGDRQVYMGKYKTPHSLKQPEYASSIISVDDRQPPFEYAKGKRMWFYNAIDLGSECFTTFVYGQTKEGIIMDFYRQLVRNYAEWGFNLPAEIEAESSLNSSFKNTFLREGNMFENVRIEANNARGKRIEQYYKPLRYQYEKKDECWLARPFALSESNQAGAEPKQEKIIPYDELVERRLKDLENWNNTAHSKYPNMSRWDYFISKQNPNLKPTNYKGILPHLGYHTTTSCNVGVIKLQRKEFLIGDNGNIIFSDDLINVMTIIEGKTLDVYWLDANDGSVLKAFAYLNDTYICELIPKPVYSRAQIEQTPEDMEQREQMSKYVASIEAFGKRSRNSIDKVTVITNKPFTLNRNFKIPGLRSDENPNPTEDRQVEVLKPVFDEYESIPETTNPRPALKDRF